MTLSPLARTSGIAVLVFGAAVAAHFLLQPLHARPSTTSMNALYLTCAVLLGLGWIGLGELRALDKRSLVKTLQIVALVLALPVLLFPGARNAFAVVAAAVVVFAAFPLAFWYRRERRMDKR